MAKTYTFLEPPSEEKTIFQREIEAKEPVAVDTRTTFTIESLKSDILSLQTQAIEASIEFQARIDEKQSLLSEASLALEIPDIP